MAVRLKPIQYEEQKRLMREANTRGFSYQEVAEIFNTTKSDIQYKLGNEKVEPLKK